MTTTGPTPKTPRDYASDAGGFIVALIVGFIMLWFAGAIFYGAVHPGPFTYPEQDYPPTVAGDREP